MTKFEEAWAQ